MWNWWNAHRWRNFPPANDSKTVILSEAKNLYDVGREKDAEKFRPKMPVGFADSNALAFFVTPFLRMTN